MTQTLWILFSLDGKNCIEHQTDEAVHLMSFMTVKNKVGITVQVVYAGVNNVQHLLTVNCLYYACL